MGIFKGNKLLNDQAHYQAEAQRSWDSNLSICEVASHYFKLTSKLTSLMLVRSGLCEVASLF